MHRRRRQESTPCTVRPYAFYCWCGLSPQLPLGLGGGVASSHASAKLATQCPPVANSSHSLDHLIFLVALQGQHVLSYHACTPGPEHCNGNKVVGHDTVLIDCTVVYVCVTEHLPFSKQSFPLNCQIERSASTRSHNVCLYPMLPIAIAMHCPIYNILH